MDNLVSNSVKWRYPVVIYNYHNPDNEIDTLPETSSWINFNWKKLIAMFATEAFVKEALRILFAKIFSQTAGNRGFEQKQLNGNSLYLPSVLP